ncbi:hypothetical protein MKW98_006133 [Papaver atlanticum]|uniref:BTB domain-containing protein n=1 Tax=Papaver atlanticum TaxID=357466 RepID=A0AAD4TGP4_9MAGN|nr:hypothetical protein MKW98_006133 [Papaver atlanticum]
MRMQSDKVRLNVGGKIFETTATTLASARRDSMFGAMFDDEWNLRPREVNQEYFIDRDPDCFSVLLNLLRTGELYVPPHIPDRLFYREALYYGLLDHVRTAKICKFDCNWLKLKSSVSDQAPDDWTAVRASPDGGCAVAHGGVVRVYNWMLEEHPPLNLDYQCIKDIGWIDSENIVISSCQKTGGIGLFSSSTGDLRHRFKLNCENDEVKGFAAGVLCFNSDGKIFASCGETSNGGIGVWDQVTGKQTDYFNSSDGLCFADANKIQWLNGSNCLFVSNLFSWMENKKHISLLDFRDKSVVCSRISRCISVDRYYSPSYILDAIPMEESNSICVVNEYEKFGFVDLRNTSESVTWSSNSYGSVKPIDHPKLTLHGGQLFCSLYDKISVYYGGLDQWVLTSVLERSQAGSIRDFSIGGDRLFALRGEENVVDIWETPSSPII